MIVMCYHNGALGHSVSALIETCTEEGSGTTPLFVVGENLHHYRSAETLFRIKHPQCDVSKEQELGNIVISSSSRSVFGRLLIVLMGLKKWSNGLPDLDSSTTYKQYGDNYGEQLEILSLTLRDKITSVNDWFLDADYVLDIISFWDDVSAVCEWLRSCGFVPIEERVRDFCLNVAATNQQYYDIIDKCVKIVADVVNHKQYDIDVTFYEVAMCHALLLEQTSQVHRDLKLLQKHPTNTKDLIDIFYG